MDILSLFRLSPEKKIERLRKKAKEPHGDAAVRYGACQKLYEMGTPEAVLALLDRFTISVSPAVQDEDEKLQVLEWVVSYGEKAVEPLNTFLRRERQVYWPLRALKRILSEDRLIRQCNELLRYHWENPPATTEPQAQLIRALQGLHSDELEKTVRRYLQEKDDDVLLAALDYLFERPAEDTREAILECYLDCEERPRVRSHILEQLEKKGWHVKGYRPKVEESLPLGYVLTREGVPKKIGMTP